MMRDVVKSENINETYYYTLVCGHRVVNLRGFHAIEDFKRSLWCDVCHSLELNKGLTNVGALGGPMKDAQYNPKETSIFTELLNSMQAIHDKKKHDYTSNNDPYGNYRFAGKLSKLFNNPDDAGFAGRIGEKLYRLANLDNSGKTAINETVEDTEVDICTIVVLWMASRKERRIKGISNGSNLETF